MLLVGPVIYKSCYIYQQFQVSQKFTLTCSNKRNVGYWLAKRKAKLVI